jgi:hypothetical protein
MKKNQNCSFFLTDNVALPAQHSTEKSKVVWKQNEKYVLFPFLVTPLSALSHIQ